MSSSASTALTAKSASMTGSGSTGCIALVMAADLPMTETLRVLGARPSSTARQRSSPFARRAHEATCDEHASRANEPGQTRLWIGSRHDNDKGEEPNP